MMKDRRLKRLVITFAVIVSLLCTTAISGAAAPVQLYNGSHFTGVTIGSADVAAQKFTADDSFYSITVRAASYGDNDGSLTLKLYAWDSDYNATVAAAPIWSRTFTDFHDNEWLRLQFPVQTSGVYMWTLSNADGWVGVWQAVDSVYPAAQAYWNGLAATGGYQAKVYYGQPEPQPNQYDSDNFSAVTIGAGDTAASRFTAYEKFFSLDVRTPSYGDNNGNLTLKLYAWDTDYAASLASSPLVSKTFHNFADNAWLRIQFPELPAGQYIWTLSGATGWVGVWKSVDSAYPATSYFNGVETSGDYQARLYYGDYDTAAQTMYSHMDTSVRPILLQGSATAGEQFTAVWPFTMLEVNAPSYGDNQGSLTLSLYEWDTDYATTVSAAPLASQTFVDFADNEWLSMRVEERPAGEYLWVLSDGSGGVGIWQTASNNLFPGTPYINGAVSEAFGDFKARITYARNQVLPNLPTFSLSDTGYAESLNHMFKTLYTLSLGPSPIDGNPQTNWMQWNAMTTAWMDTSVNKGKYGADYNEVLRGHLLHDVQLTPEGYVYILNATNWWGEGATLQGWPFPSTDSPNNPAVNTYRFTANTLGWTTNMSTHGIAGDEWVIQTPGSDPFLISPIQNTPADQMPFLYVEMSNTNANTSGKIYFITNSDPVWDEAKSVAFTVDNSGKRRGYQINMQKNPKWAGTITRYRVDPVEAGQAGGQVAISVAKGEYDTRHVQTNTAFVLGSAELFLWNPSDVAFLQGNIGRMRQALHYLKAEFDPDDNHYLTVRWSGHEGTSGIDPNKPPGEQRYVHGRGIGSNYWDILPIGYKDFYDTIYYYEALQKMAQLEALIEANPGWAIPSNPFGESSSVLQARAELVYEAVVEGLTFWNSDTGRYVLNVDINGNRHDYGYTFVNLEALAQGLADAGRAASIFSWLDGGRTVAGDTSTGADIYAHQFAARASTKRNTEWYNMIWTRPEDYPFGDQVQDGGAIMYVNYYDVMARLKYKSADDAWARFADMLDLHQQAREEGGYRSYYSIRGIHMQGDGGPPGGIGIDAEFTESALAPLAFLYGFLGIHTQTDGLVVAPRIPSSLGWIGVDNVFYDGAAVSVHASTTATTVTIDSDSGSKWLKIGNLAPNTTYAVQRDGAAWQTYTADSAGFIRFATTGAGEHSYQISL